MAFYFLFAFNDVRRKGHPFNGYYFFYIINPANAESGLQPGFVNTTHCNLIWVAKDTCPNTRHISMLNSRLHLAILRL
jgi:hypothetical protein